jgi:hypothetical protein
MSTAAQDPDAMRTAAVSTPDASAVEQPAGASEGAPRPLSSLSSLLGDSFAGGQACDADGSCA